VGLLLGVVGGSEVGQGEVIFSMRRVNEGREGGREGGAIVGDFDTRFLNYMMEV